MTPPIIVSDGGITLIGGGQVDSADLKLALRFAPRLVAADGGADTALAAGIVPEAVIGDLDSISDVARDRLADRLHRIDEQDSTDFEKCLQHIGASFVLAVGFAGDRLDHTLAALSVMARRMDPPVVLLTSLDVVLCLPAELSLPLPAGTRVSLFPMGPCGGTSTGLRWPIAGLRMDPAGRIGTSNEATGPVSMTMQGPMLAILPRECLALVVETLWGETV